MRPSRPTAVGSPTLGRCALVAVALLTVLTLLTGCGASPSPKPLPRTAPTPSASATPRPTPPAMPALARKKTRAGAIAAVTYFLQALNYSGRSGNTRGLRASYTRTCTRCEAISQGIDRTYAAGGYYRGAIGTPGGFASTRSRGTWLL